MTHFLIRDPNTGLTHDSGDLKVSMQGQLKVYELPPDPIRAELLAALIQTRDFGYLNDGAIWCRINNAIEQAEGQA